jgi:DNA-binding transcriptional LysR family regulator
MPASATDLVRHALIGFDADPVLIRAAQSLGLDLSRDAFVVRSDSEHAQFAALRAGIGIGACQRGIARREPDLLPVLPDRIGFTLDMWLVTHEDLRANRRVRQVYDVLYRRLAQYAQPQR